MRVVGLLSLVVVVGMLGVVGVEEVGVGVRDNGFGVRLSLLPSLISFSVPKTGGDAGGCGGPYFSLKLLRKGTSFSIG